VTVSKNIANTILFPSGHEEDTQTHANEIYSLPIQRLSSKTLPQGCGLLAGGQAGICHPLDVGTKAILCTFSRGIKFDTVMIFMDVQLVSKASFQLRR
jgi:hypothetical protein